MNRVDIVRILFLVVGGSLLSIIIFMLFVYLEYHASFPRVFYYAFSLTIYIGPIIFAGYISEVKHLRFLSVVLFFLCLTSIMATPPWNKSDSSMFSVCPRCRYTGSTAMEQRLEAIRLEHLRQQINVT